MHSATRHSPASQRSPTNSLQVIQSTPTLPHTHAHFCTPNSHTPHTAISPSLHLHPFSAYLTISSCVLPTNHFTPHSSVIPHPYPVFHVCIQLSHPSTSSSMIHSLSHTSETNIIFRSPFDCSLIYTLVFVILPCYPSLYNLRHTGSFLFTVLMYKPPYIND